MGTHGKRTRVKEAGVAAQTAKRKTGASSSQRSRATQQKSRVPSSSGTVQMTQKLKRKPTKGKKAGMAATNSKTTSETAHKVKKLRLKKKTPSQKPSAGNKSIHVVATQFGCRGHAHQQQRCCQALVCPSAGDERYMEADLRAAEIQRMANNTRHRLVQILASS